MNNPRPRGPLLMPFKLLVTIMNFSVSNTKKNKKPRLNFNAL
jgi:hypothetical protein